MAKLVSTIYGDALFELALEENKMDILFRACFERDNAIVIQISDDRKIQKTLTCFDV